MKNALKMMACVFMMSAYPAQAKIFPKVVSELDVNDYQGHWYEVASTRPFFQRGCVCVRADYTLRDDGVVKVVNTCRRDGVQGEDQEIVGEARTTKNPAKFKVKFGPIAFPFSNYWVIQLADDYSYAVVSTPIGSPVWLLSRTPELSAETRQLIDAKLIEQGFNPKALTDTPQAGCYE